MDHCQCGMLRSQVVARRKLSIRRVAANILNKQSRTADKGRSTSFGVWPCTIKTVVRQVARNGLVLANFLKIIYNSTNYSRILIL